MLDKPTKDQDPAPGWRFPRFLRFGDNGDTTTLPKARKPPQEPEERKQQPGAARLGELLCGGTRQQVLRLRERLGGGRK